MNTAILNYHNFFSKIEDRIVNKFGDQNIPSATLKATQCNESKYPFTYQDLLSRQNQNKILYIHLLDNRYYAVTTNGEVIVQINSFRKLTELPMFIRVNRNYLVNLHHVLHIHKKTHEITMSNQDIIEISKRKWNKFLVGFMQELS